MYTHWDLDNWRVLVLFSLCTRDLQKKRQRVKCILIPSNTHILNLWFTDYKPNSSILTTLPSVQPLEIFCCDFTFRAKISTLLDWTNHTTGSSTGQLNLIALGDAVWLSLCWYCRCHHRVGSQRGYKKIKMGGIRFGEQNSSTCLKQKKTGNVNSGVLAGGQRPFSILSLFDFSFFV